MAKDKIFIGLAGMIVGLVIGFLITNSVNRSASGSEQAAASPNSASKPNPALPPDHPPLAQNEIPQDGAALPQVMEAIEKAKQQPDDFESQMTAGDLYYQIERFEDAAVFYAKANKLNPNENEPVIKLGNSLFDAEKYEEAEKWYLAALKKAPNDVNVRTDLGLTFFLRTPRDIERAIKEYNASLTLEPDNEIALQNLALAYRELGDTGSLQKTMEKLRQVNPGNPLFAKTAPQ